jgi:pimeloyl-ACP methyl ester carboxylesterase
MGGYISLEIMRQAPERVTRLALLDTSARPDTPEQTAGRRALVALALGGRFEAVLRNALPAILHPAHRQDPRLLEVNVRMARAVGPQAMARQQAAIIARPDSRPDLELIRVPALVLVGDADPLTPPDVAQEIASLIPGARLVVIPGCGHASTLEQPELVARALVEWLTL